jgi:class 3 adenylate cyclase/tetratricopeptide (TPR) repeat protein
MESRTEPAGGGYPRQEEIQGEVTDPKTEPVRIFVSYSHRDPAYLGDDSLLGFLKGLEHDEQVEFWTDERIEAGTFWNDQIRQRLLSSDIALVLVSQAFLDSPYCSSTELSTFLERCRDEGLIIFPIVLSPCEWERHEWLATRQFLPGGNETIEEHYVDPGRRKRLYLRIRQELRSAVSRAREARQSAAAKAAPAAPLPERRQLTVLQCELIPTEPSGDPIAGDELPEIVHELYREFQKTCAQVFTPFEGQIKPSWSGVTVRFGYPVAHEDDSRRAVRAGLALIEALGTQNARFERELGVRLAVRVGVHTGIVIAGTTHQAEDTFAGSRVLTDGVRMHHVAPINSVVVSEATYKLVRDFFEMEEVTSIPLGTSRELAHVYRVNRDTGFQSRLDAVAAGWRLTALTGREKELDLLVARWNEARRGSGQVVLLCAEAGVGKSRLVAELKSRTADQKRVWNEFRCSSYHENSALYPLMMAFELWLGLEPGDSDETKLRRLESHLAPIGSPLEEVVPSVAALLSIPCEHKYGASPQTVRHQTRLTLDVLAQLVIDAATATPMLLVVEDLHWVDPSTEEFLDILVEQAATLPLLLLFTFHPEYAPPASWLSRQYTSQMALDRLDRDNVLNMILAITGGKPLPAEIVREIVRKTDGSPLFVEDLTRMVIESDLLVENEDCYAMAGPFQSLKIPATLQETLMARMAKLATAKPVAQVAATIGREFDFEMLRDVGGFEEQMLREELNRLVSAGLLYRRGLLSRARYIFKHALVQEALQQSLLKRQRRNIHKLVAATLESKSGDVAGTQPELVAYHYEEAGETMKAVEYWQRGAERAMARSANREALAHVRRATEQLLLLPEDEQRWTTELALRGIEGPALLALKGWTVPELVVCNQRARELCRLLPRTQKLFGVLRGMWTSHLVGARLTEALAIANELFEMATAANDEDFLLEARGALCDTLFWLGRPADSLEQGRLGLGLYDVDRHHVSHSVAYGEDPAAMFYTYSALSLALLGKPQESLDLTRTSIDLLDRFTHIHSRAFLLFGIAWGFIQLRDARNAGVYSQKLIDISIENDFGAWLPIGEVMKGWSMATKHGLDKGVALMKHGRLQWHATGGGTKSCFYPALLADLHFRAGALDDALEWVVAGFQAAAACDDRYYFPELHRVNGDVFAALGRHQVAMAAYDDAVKIAREQKAKLLELRAVTGLAKLQIARGGSDSAVANLAALLEELSGNDELPDVAEASAVLAGVQKVS